MQDMKIAEKVFERAVKEEERLLRLYGKDWKPSRKRRECTEQTAGEGGESDCQEKLIKEKDFLKAQDKYRQKRKKMELQINKILQKELRKVEVSKQIEQELKSQVECQ